MDSDFTTKTCREFTELLSSDSPVPGGGSASAMMGALGIALGNMVGALTVGKMKYKDVEEDIKALNTRAEELRDELLAMVKKDVEGFKPLAKAYGIPKDDPNRESAMEEATIKACEAPMEIMEKCSEAIKIIREYANKGSSLAISDAGCGAVCAKAALYAASLCVFINTKTLKNREIAGELDDKADYMLEKYGHMADVIFKDVYSSFKVDKYD